MRYFVTLDGDEERAIDVFERPGGQVEVRVDGEPVLVDTEAADGALNVRVGERVFDLWLEGRDGRYAAAGVGLRVRAAVESERSRIGAAAARSAGASGGQVSSPMPGRVVEVLVALGDQVAAGTPIIVVEAMKMENELCCEQPGVVTAIRASAGDSVDGGAVLVELGPARLAGES